MSPSPAALAAAKEIEAQHVWGRMETQRIQERAEIIDRHFALNRIAEKDDCEPTRIQLNADGTWNTFD